MRFATGFVSIDHFEYPPTQLRGRNWRIRFGQKTEESYSCTSTLLGNRTIPPKEVFIIAKTETVARRVASDIVGAMTLLQCGSVLIPEMSDALDWQCEPPPKVKRLHSGGWSMSGFPLACRIAARAASRLRLQYALAKFKLSCETASFASVDLDPYHSETIPRGHRAEDHVRLATAIVIAYSVLEELGLEVRASA
jgi:hypothetical protein